MPKICGASCCANPEAPTYVVGRECQAPCCKEIPFPYRQIRTGLGAKIAAVRFPGERVYRDVPKTQLDAYHSDGEIRARTQ